MKEEITMALYTAERLAEMLGIQRSTVQQLVRAGEFVPTVNVARKHLVTEDGLRRLSTTKLEYPLVFKGGDAVMICSRKKMVQRQVLNVLLDAQKNMASAEKVDARGLVYLSRFLLRLLKKLDDELVQLSTEEKQ